MMAQQNGDKFDITIVHDSFLNAVHEDDDVKIELYLSSFGELNKFFNLIGTIFGFVSKDLQEKINILDSFLKNEDTCQHFETVKKMIVYEKENDLLVKKGYTSGSRTLLRLHRGLDFIKLFLKKLSELKNEENTSVACREAYDQTLSKHHPLIIRSGAKVAIYTLPTRENLLKRVCGEDEEIQKAMEMLPKTLEITSEIFDRIEKLYTINDLHKLP